MGAVPAAGNIVERRVSVNGNINNAGQSIGVGRSINDGRRAIDIRPHMAITQATEDRLHADEIRRSDRTAARRRAALRLHY
jgi:hypothetical protein